MRHSSQRSSLIITEQRRMNMGKLTYIRCGDYDIPNLKLSEQPETSILGRRSTFRTRSIFSE